MIRKSVIPQHQTSFLGLFVFVQITAAVFQKHHYLKRRGSVETQYEENAGVILCMRGTMWCLWIRFLLV